MKFYEDCIRVLNVMALKNDSKLTTDICTKNTGNHQNLGVAETSFKERYSNYTRDFKHKRYMKCTELSKYI